MSPVKPIPDGYPQITPYLIVDGADRAIDYYKQVFGFTERMRMDAPEGRIGHCELTIGDSMIMLADAFPEMGILAPPQAGGSPVTISVYVEDVDAVFDKAVQLGAKPLRPVENQFYGDRNGQLEDPFGHRWSVASHVEDVAPDEMAARVRAQHGE
jgi:PhnB protein